MKKVIFLLFIISLLQLASCEDEILGGTKSLNINNNTSERMYYWYSREYAHFHYPDTILPLEKPVQIGEVAPNGGSGTGPINPSWEQIFSELPQNKFSVYFFETKPRTQEEWNELRNNPETFHRKDVSLEELKDNDYRIFYP